MKHWHKILAAVLVAGILLAGCDAGSAVLPTAPTTLSQSPMSGAAIKAVTPNEAATLIRDNPGLVLLDVRTPAEFAAGHLSGALDIDYYSDTFRAQVGKLDKNVAYLVYCRTGGRSAASAKIMEELGFRTINDLSGGITAWESAGLPTVK